MCESFKKAGNSGKSSFWSPPVSLGSTKFSKTCIACTTYSKFPYPFNCDYIIQDAHKKTKKKHTPPKAAAIRLTLLLFPMCTKPHARYQNAEPPNQRNRSQLASRSNCTHLKEISPPQYRIYIDNTLNILIIHILYILIIHILYIYISINILIIHKKTRARLIYFTIRVNQI